MTAITAAEIVARAQTWYDEHQSDALHHITLAASTPEGHAAHQAAMSAHIRAMAILRKEMEDPSVKVASARAIIRAAAIAASEQAVRADNATRPATLRKAALNRALECERRATRVLVQAIHNAE